MAFLETLFWMLVCIGAGALIYWLKYIRPEAAEQKKKELELKEREIALRENTEGNRPIV